MGDTPSTMTSPRTTDLTSLSSSATQSPDPLLIRLLKPQEQSTSTMPDTSSQSSREMSDEELTCLQKIQSIEAKRQQSEQRNQALLAQLAAFKKQDEEDQRLLEDLQKQKDQAVLKHNKLREKRTQRQTQFQSTITGEVITELVKSIERDIELRTAIQLIADNDGEKSHYQLLKNFMIDEFMGSEDKIWHSLALKFLEKVSTPTVQLSTDQTSSERSSSSCHVTADQINKIEGPITVCDKPSQLIGAVDPLEQAHNTVAPTTQTTQQSDLAKDAERASDDSNLGISTTTPQEVADLVNTDTIEPKQTADTENITTPLKIKNEHDADMPPPSAKRRRLQTMESSPAPMVLQYCINTPSSGTTSGLTTPANDQPVTNTPRSRGRNSSVRSEPQKRSKRTRDDISVDSHSSKSSSLATKPAPTSNPPKKQLPALQAFKKKLDEALQNDESVQPELACQKCDKPPRVPTVTSCVHLYCKLCLTKLRKEASKADIEVQCTTCNLVVKRRGTRVPEETFRRWKKEFGGGGNSDGGGDGSVEDVGSPLSEEEEVPGDGAGEELDGDDDDEWT